MLLALVWTMVGCGTDPACVDFCKDVGCKADEASCEYDGACACHGCTAYYEAVYDGDEEPPECTFTGPEGYGEYGGFYYE